MMVFDGPSTIVWTKKEWDEQHAAYYTPILQISQPLPAAVELIVSVKEDRSVAVDPEFAKFYVLFPAGGTTGVVRTTNDTLAQSRGFPAVTNGRFWLVATKEGRIKGNIDKDNDCQAKIYLQVSSWRTWAYRGAIPVALIDYHKLEGRRLVAMETRRKTVRCSSK
jgi:hypothetical protein